MNQVEERVLDCVAALYPKPFHALERYLDRYPRYVDATIARFDREVQFYLACLDYVRRFADHDLPLCFPDVDVDADEVRVDGGFDVALAERLMESARPVVRNDVRLAGRERIIVVTGPNQSGKTAFARMIGQVLALAAFGVAVPGTRARVPLIDRLFTNFERKESVATLHGKLDEELARVHRILDEASARSVIVMNESFGATTVDDAVRIGAQVLDRIATVGSVAVYVTFLDELAARGPATVSMSATVAADDPTRRTFRFVRKPADSRAHARAFARRYGLTHDLLRDRLAR
jgi:DNA mismatch repair ATPase MutS